jgi:spore germination protein KC
MIALLIIISITMTGCWDSVETEDLGVIRVVGLGMSKNNDIRVIIQEIPHEKQTGGNQGTGTADGGKSSFYLYAASAPTISEAIQRMAANEHHKLYFAHTNIIILEEELVSSIGIKSIVDFLERNPEIRLSSWILIAPTNQFDKILSTDVGIGLDTGGMLEETINNKRGNSFITIDNLGDFIELVNKSGCEAYASGVSMISKGFANETITNSQSSKQKFYVRDTAVFKGDKMVGWLVNEEYKGFSWINGAVKGAIINIPFGDEVLSLRIVRIKSKLQPIIDNGKMKMNINIEVLSNIAESRVKYNFMNEDTIKKVEQLQSEKIKSEITAALEKSKRLGSDVFGMGSYFNMKYPEFWKGVKDNWESYYPEVKVNINVDSKVKNIGNTYRLFKK